MASFGSQFSKHRMAAFLDERQPVHTECAVRYCGWLDFCNSRSPLRNQTSALRMTQPIALVQLISEKTMQNLLPLLALRPKEVVQVRSEEERFCKAAENFERAVVSLQKTLFYRFPGSLRWSLTKYRRRLIA